jgi:hypothetical protein
MIFWTIGASFPRDRQLPGSCESEPGGDYQALTRRLARARADNFASPAQRPKALSVETRDTKQLYQRKAVIGTVNNH